MQPAGEVQEDQYGAYSKRAKRRTVFRFQFFNG
jgi:hypothetical protein